MFLGDAHPRAEVNFINGLWRTQRVARRALLHPVAVVPLVVEVPHHGCGAGRLLMQKAEGIGLVNLIAVTSRLDVEFVERTLGHPGNEAFPDPGVSTGGEKVGARTTG